MLAVRKDCGIKCRSKDHILQICTAITKGTHRQLQLFICSCHYALVNTDAFGRTILHVLAACGKKDEIAWLFDTTNLSTTAKDNESGWTACHRALFYGQLSVARLLIANGADITISDREGLTPFGVATKDQLQSSSLSGPCEVYTWGSNANFNLGHESESVMHNPEQVELFRRQKTRIKQVAVSKYHSFFVTALGQVFSCGHGRGGRLGHGDELTYLKPKLIEGVKHEQCSHVSTSAYGCVLLTESCAIYGYSADTENAIGLPCEKTPKLINPKPFRNKQVINALVGRYHVVVLCTDALFTWGLNAGQLGHMKVATENAVKQPRQVSALHHKDITLTLVASSDAAVVTVTKSGDVYFLHGYKCHKIGSRFIDCQQVAIVGGHLDTSVMKVPGVDPIVFVRLSSGKVFAWHYGSGLWYRCQWVIARPLRVVDMAVSRSKLAIVTNEGEVFTGNIAKMKFQTPLNNTARVASVSEYRTVGAGDAEEAPLVERVAVQRVSFLHRALTVTLDEQGHNMAVLQAVPNADLTDLPDVSSSTIIQDMKELLLTSDLQDPIHDLTVSVGSRVFAVHRYILALRSEYFRNIIFENSNMSHVVLGNMLPAIFQQVLFFLYTDCCDFLYIGRAIDSSLRCVGEDVDIFQLFVNAAKTLKIKALIKRLEAVRLRDGRICSLPNKHLPPPSVRYDRHKYGALADLTLRSSDEVTFKCHKVVLVARSEYFRGMFASAWNESDSGELTLPLESNVLENILDYLYGDECPKLTDQLLLTRLRELCESILASLVSLKNVGDMIQLASTYNAAQLKQTCLQFIKLNISELLECRLLDVLDDEVMDEVTSYYRQNVAGMDRRIITPWDAWPHTADLEELEREHAGVEISGDLLSTAATPQKRSRRARRHRQRTKSSSAVVSHMAPVDRQSSISSFSETDDVHDTSMECMEADVSRLTLSPRQPPPVSPGRQPPPMSPGPTDLRQIMEQEERVSKKTEKTQFKTMTKLSQRERKKLQIPATSSGADVCRQPAVSAWGSPTSPGGSGDGLSFRRLMQEQARTEHTEEVRVVSDVIGSPVRTTPWAGPRSPSPCEAPLSSPEVGHSFSTIMKEAISQEEELSKAKKKPFSLIQIEESAVAQLRQMYQNEHGWDETVTIEHIQYAMATPIWDAKASR